MSNPQNDEAFDNDAFVEEAGASIEETPAPGSPEELMAFLELTPEDVAGLSLTPLSEDVQGPAPSLDAQLVEMVGEAPAEGFTKAYEDLRLLEPTLASLAQEMAQLKSQDLLAGLPQDGVFQVNGEPIYTLPDEKIKLYLKVLQDHGHHQAVSAIQQALGSFRDKCRTLETKYGDYQKVQQKYAALKNQVEWEDAVASLRGRLPELTPEDLARVGAYLTHRMALDPAFSKVLQTRQGKRQITVETLAHLGILKRFREQAQKPRKMTQAEFNRLSEEEIDRLFDEVIERDNPFQF